MLELWFILLHLGLSASRRVSLLTFVLTMETPDFPLAHLGMECLRTLYLGDDVICHEIGMLHGSNMGSFYS